MTPFDYSTFIGTSNYFWDEDLSTLVYWTDGVSALIKNNHLKLIISVVDVFLRFMKNDKLSISSTELDMLCELSFWNLTASEKHLHFSVLADSTYKPCFEYKIPLNSELDFESIKLYCSKYGCVYVLMLNSEY